MSEPVVDIKQRAKELLIKNPNTSLTTVVKELGLKVGKARRVLAQAKLDISMDTKTQSSPGPTSQAQVPQALNASSNPGVPPGLNYQPPNLGQPEAPQGDLNTVLQHVSGVRRTVEMQVTTLQEKIVLDAEVLLYYDYAVKLGFMGDLGAFLRECVKTTYEERGIRLSFIRTV